MANENPFLRPFLPPIDSLTSPKGAVLGLLDIAQAAGRAVDTGLGHLARGPIARLDEVAGTHLSRPDVNEEEFFRSLVSQATGDRFLPTVAFDILRDPVTYIAPPVSLVGKLGAAGRRLIGTPAGRAAADFLATTGGHVDDLINRVSAALPDSLSAQVITGLDDAKMPVFEGTRSLTKLAQGDSSRKAVAAYREFLDNTRRWLMADGQRLDELRQGIVQQDGSLDPSIITDVLPDQLSGAWSANNNVNTKMFLDAADSVNRTLRNLQKHVSDVWTQVKPGEEFPTALPDTPPLADYSNVFRQMGLIPANAPDFTSTGELLTALRPHLTPKDFGSLADRLDKWQFGDILGENPLQNVMEHMVSQFANQPGIKNPYGALQPVVNGLEGINNYFREVALASPSYVLTNLLGGALMGGMRGVDGLRAIQRAKENLLPALRGEQVLIPEMEQLLRATGFVDEAGKPVLASGGAQQAGIFAEGMNSPLQGRRSQSALERLGPTRTGLAGAGMGALGGYANTPDDATTTEALWNVILHGATGGAFGMALGPLLATPTRRMAQGSEDVMRQLATSTGARESLANAFPELLNLLDPLLQRGPIPIAGPPAPANLNVPPIFGPEHLTRMNPYWLALLHDLVAEKYGFKPLPRGFPIGKNPDGSIPDYLFWQQTRKPTAWPQWPWKLDEGVDFANLRRMQEAFINFTPDAPYPQARDEFYKMVNESPEILRELNIFRDHPAFGGPTPSQLPAPAPPLPTGRPPVQGPPAPALTVDEVRTILGDTSGMISPKALSNLLTRAGFTEPEITPISDHWRNRVQSAMEAGKSLSDSIHFNYPDLNNIQDLVRVISPFSTWIMKAYPFFAQRLAENPVFLSGLASYALESERNQYKQGLPARFEGSMPGSSAANAIWSALLGKPASTAFNPLKGVVPFSDTIRAAGQPENDDQSGIEQLINTANMFGFGFHPAIDFGLKLSGLMGYNEPSSGYLRHGAPIQGATALLGLNRGRGVNIDAAVPAGLDSARRALGQDPTIPVEAMASRRLDEIAFARTGKSITSGDPAVAPYLMAKTAQRGPLWDSVMAEVARERGTRSLVGFGAGVLAPQAILPDDEAAIRQVRQGNTLPRSVHESIKTRAQNDPQGAPRPEDIEAVWKIAKQLKIEGGIDTPDELKARLTTNAITAEFAKNVYDALLSLHPELGIYSTELGAQAQDLRNRMEVRGNPAALLLTQNPGMNPASLSPQLRAIRELQEFNRYGLRPDMFTRAGTAPYTKARESFDAANPLIPEYFSWRRANPQGGGIGDFLRSR